MICTSAGPSGSGGCVVVTGGSVVGSLDVDSVPEEDPSTVVVSSEGCVTYFPFSNSSSIAATRSVERASCAVMSPLSSTSRTAKTRPSEESSCAAIRRIMRASAAVTTPSPFASPRKSAPSGASPAAKTAAEVERSIRTAKNNAVNFFIKNLSFCVSLPFDYTILFRILQVAKSSQRNAP